MDLAEKLRKNAEACARGINAPAIGSDPKHYLTGMAADEIDNLRAENKRLRKLLSRYEALTDDTPKLEFIPDPNEPWRGTVRAKKEG